MDGTQRHGLGAEVIGEVQAHGTAATDSGLYDLAEGLLGACASGDAVRSIRQLEIQMNFTGDTGELVT